MICLAVNVTVDLIVGVTVSWVSQLTQGDLLLRNSKGCRHTKGWIFFGGKRAVYLNGSGEHLDIQHGDGEANIYTRQVANIPRFFTYI